VGSSFKLTIFVYKNARKIERIWLKWREDEKLGESHLKEIKMISVCEWRATFVFLVFSLNGIDCALGLKLYVSGNGGRMELNASRTSTLHYNKPRQFQAETSSQ